jgi:hypothetical protein
MPSSAAGALKAGVTVSQLAVGAAARFGGRIQHFYETAAHRVFDLPAREGRPRPWPTIPASSSSSRTR